MEDIAGLEFINEDFIEAWFENGTKVASDIVQGCAPGLNRSLKVKKNRDGSHLIHGFFRSSMTKTWYETKVTLNEETISDYQCSCKHEYVSF